MSAEVDDESKKKRSAPKRKVGKPARKPKVSRDVQQKHTELTALYHIFHDMVYEYMGEEEIRRLDIVEEKVVPNFLSREEKFFLKTLLLQLSQKVETQDRLIHDNRSLVAEKKRSHLQVENIRNEILVARMQIQRLKSECTQLENERKKGEKRQDALNGANRLLNALHDCVRAAKPHE